MAIHTQLPIYRVVYDLLDVVADINTNMNRKTYRTAAIRAASANQGKA